MLILTVCLYLLCCLLNFRGNVIDMQFLPIKLPPVHGPPFFYKSTQIALDENHIGNCSGLMVPTSKILGIGSPPTCFKDKDNIHRIGLKLAPFIIVRIAIRWT